MKVIDIANDIYLENASPSDTSIASIAYWIRANVGKLNTLLYESFYVHETTYEVLSSDGTEINILAADIIKTMYKVYRTDLDIRKNIVSIQADSILQAKDQDFSVVRLNRNEVLKSLNTMKSTAVKELRDLVHDYRSYHATPTQVAGDDTMRGYFPTRGGGFERSTTPNSLN